MRVLRQILLLAFALYLPTLPGSAAVSDEKRPAAVMTATELKRKILSACDAIHSLRVSYNATGYLVKEVFPGAYVHRDVIMRAPCSFFEDSAHGYQGCRWQDDLFRQTAYVTATRLCNVFPVNRAYFLQELSSNAGLPGTLPAEAFALATGIWPLTGRQAPRPDGRPHILREVAVSDDYNQLRQEQEMLDGRWCHVLMSGSRDILWLDTSRNCCLMQREIFVKDTGILKTRYKLSDYREVSKGIWLPRAIRFEEYDINAPTSEGRRRKIRDTPIEILKATVNDVDDDAFQYSVPPGALEIDGKDLRNPPRQSRPGGEGHLDEIVSWIQRNGASPQARAWRIFGWSDALGALLVLTIVVGCEAEIRVARNRKAKKTPQNL